MFPFLTQLQSNKARFPLLILLSCWRWGVENGADFPEYCPHCHERVTSEHLLFSCQMTDRFRMEFTASTGTDFMPGSLTEDDVAVEFAALCESICNLVRDFQSL
jgi:hypothetical protein